jgi:hypothetical protein
MATNTSGLLGAASREYNGHQRHAKFARLRHDNQRLAWLTRIATKLSSTTTIIFARLTKYGARRVGSATNISQLP